MAEWTWELDASSGVFKNHALSSKIREAAIANSVFVPYVDAEPGYGRRRGESVTITRIRNIAEPTNPRFGERERVPIDQFQMSTVAITVSYFGRGVEFTEKGQLLSHYDLKDKIQRMLRRQMQLSLDTAAAAAFKTAKVCFIPTSLAGGVFDTDGTPSTTALENLTVVHVQTIRDYMQDTLHVPGFRGGDRYVAIASTRALRGLKRDPEWREWKAPQQSAEAFGKGMVGTIENIDFIESNHTNALANNKGSGSVLGEAVFFGDDAVSMAVVEDPELRVAIPGNFGLSQAVAWVGLLEFGLVWDTANDGEARVIRLTSA
jgi:N4-gp56 family major capsid protein